MPIINLLNFNSFQKPLLSNDVKNEYKGERCDFFVDNEIEKFDIIALQEQFTFINPRPISLLDKALQKGFTYFYKTKEPKLTGKTLCGDGLLVLSRFPILDGDSTIFESSVSIDRLIAKGAMWTLIELPNNRRLHLFNTHLVATFNHLTQDEYIFCKIKGITQLIQLRCFINEKLEKHFEKGDLAILCGDLNVNALNNEFSCNEVLDHIEIDNKLRSILKAENNELKFYERILEYNNRIFKMTHTFFKDHQFYPVTMGNYYLDDEGNKIPMEAVITAEDERLDYLSLDHVYELHTMGEEDKKWLRIVPGSTKVEEFFVKNQNFTQLSDHYGLSLEIEYTI